MFQCHEDAIWRGLSSWKSLHSTFEGGAEKCGGVAIQIHSTRCSIGLLDDVDGFQCACGNLTYFLLQAVLRGLASHVTRSHSGFHDGLLFSPAIGWRRAPPPCNDRLSVTGEVYALRFRWLCNLYLWYASVWSGMTLSYRKSHHDRLYMTVVPRNTLARWSPGVPPKLCFFATHTYPIRCSVEIDSPTARFDPEVTYDASFGTLT